MPFYSRELAEQIRRAVADHHRAVAAVMFGEDAAGPGSLALAETLGVVPPPGTPVPLIPVIYDLGRAQAHATPDQRMELDDAEFPELAALIHHYAPPPTPLEEASRRFAALRGAERLVGLGNKVGATIGSNLIEADAVLDQRLRLVYRDVVSARQGDPDAEERLRQLAEAQGHDRGFYDGTFRATRSRVVSDIGHATGDWTRDLHRVTTTEVTEAVNQGFADVVTATAGADAIVYKLPRPGACPHCDRVYLDGGVPRLFRLAQLIANGTNVGRRAADYQAVVGVVHPYCGCTFHRVPSYRAAQLPKGWRSGDAAPRVIGPGGTLGGSDA